MMIGRWSLPRFAFVCQLVEVIREANANNTSGELGLALLGSLVGESQLIIPQFVPEMLLLLFTHSHDPCWWGSPIFLLVDHQPASPSGQQYSHSVGVCPQIEGWQYYAYVGAVEEMMCVVYISVTKGHSGDECDLTSTLWRYDLIYLLWIGQGWDEWGGEVYFHSY